MNILYVVYFDLEDSSNIGISKKIKAQVESFRKLEGGCDLLSISGRGMKLSSNQGESFYEYKNKSAKNYRRQVAKIISSIQNSYDLFYVRYPGSIDPSTFKLFKSLKNKKILLEIPTYPFSGEITDYMNRLKAEKKYATFFLKKILYGSDKILCKKLHKYVDLVVTYMPAENIFGITTVVIDNGVDTDKYPIVNKENKDKNSNEVSLLGVANVSVWHGYDRVIEGLSYYYNNSPSKKVIFKIIGGGDYLGVLKSKVKELNMEQYVKFLGPKYYTELMDCYKDCDIAVGSLGLHRIGLEVGSTIKVKEFCSLGLPFIYGYTERELDYSFNYALKIQGNDSAVDIKAIINFYEKFYQSDIKIKQENMHTFSELNFSWDKQLIKILEEIKIDG